MPLDGVLAANHRDSDWPLDGVLAASHDDSIEDSLWDSGGYLGGWRRERHPTASLFRISLVRGVLHPPVTKEIPSIGGGCNTPPTMG